MKRITRGLIILFVPTVLALASCAQTLEGSGTIRSLSYSTEEFTEMEFWSASDVEVRQEGNSYSVEILINDNLASHVFCRVLSGRLQVGMDRAHDYRNLDFTVSIRLPADSRPTALTVTEAVNARAALTDTGSFRLEVRDAARLTVSGGWSVNGELTFRVHDAGEVLYTGSSSNAGSIDVRMTDAGELDMGIGSSGGGNLSAALSGGSRLDMAGYEVADVQVDGRHASSIIVRTDGGSISGRLSEASSLTYLGTPSALNVQTADASSVRNGN